ncbi:hypothetical protein [Maribellus sediminis]|uniref:hypothetical protein n=1 Tax=Maribellus sediminis TaxID=2696285 RepID=UPI00142F61B5|nr:hypothetical protein [Maribellus sediminis]
MNCYKSAILLATIMLISFTGKAQFSLTGEYRPRTELSKGYKSLATEDQNASLITSQRTRLNAMFKNEFIATALVLQDVRQWGSQPQLVGNEDYGISVHEAWAEVFFNPKFALKAGRQEVVYDDHRIFGNVGWAQQARSHDMAIFKYADAVKLHFGIAHHENSDITDNIYNGPDAYKDLQFLWFNKPWENSSLSLLILNNGVPYMENEEQKNRYSQTIGGRYTTNVDEVKLASNLYIQTGKHVLGDKISALNFLIEGAFKNFVLGYEFLSGTAYNETDKYKSFTPLYGTNHKFNGFMDYFYVGNHIGSVGLNDVYLKYHYTKDQWTFDAHLHYFGAAAEVAADASNYLGTELDLAAKWTVNPFTSLTLGYSTMFAGDSMEILKGGDSSTGQHWAYLMLSVNPSFIK